MIVGFSNQYYIVDKSVCYRVHTNHSAWKSGEPIFSHFRGGSKWKDNLITFSDSSHWISCLELELATNLY